MKPYQAGRFINGDHYVIAPEEGVLISRVLPETIGVTASARNGSVKNPIPGSTHGYDGRGRGYDDELNAAQNISINHPLKLVAGDVLISTESRTQANPSKNQSFIQRAAVLTVVSQPPSADSFRPGYCDNGRTSFSAKSLRFDILPRLPVESESPQIDKVIDMFKGLWLDHVRGWAGRHFHPASNMPDYGRDISSVVGIGALTLLLDFPEEKLKELLIHFVQLGIDTFSIVQSGGTTIWMNDGGHAGGRKWPILFAGLMLNQAEMQTVGQRSGDYLYTGSYGPGNPPPDYIHFGEDDQTFYVTDEDVQITNSPSWKPDRRNKAPFPYTSNMLGMPEWGITHSTSPNRSDSSWQARYRQCCTNYTMKGIVLAALIMGQKHHWNHDALFDYQERYESIVAGKPDPFGYTVAEEKRGLSQGGFVAKMWDKYFEQFK